VAMVQFSRASLEVTRERYREAIPLLEEAQAISQSMRVAPALFLSTTQLGRVHLLLGDLPAAQRLLERAVQLAARYGLADLNYAEALGDLARTYVQVGLVEAAEPMLERAASAYAALGLDATQHDTWQAARDALVRSGAGGGASAPASM